MSEYWTIEINTISTGKIQRRGYDDKVQAMDEWDKAVDNALPGQTLRLINIGTGRIMSEYTPMKAKRHYDEYDN